MFKITKFISIALLIAASSASFAQAPAPADGGFQFTGAGTISCKEAQPLLANPNSSPQFQQWLLGFLAAYNGYSAPAQRVSLPQPQAIMAYAGDFCKANPDARFIAVASSVLQQLGAKVPPLQ